MNVKNIPFQMDADEITMLAMAKLRGSKKLSDTNVDCFIAGYTTCMNGFCEPEDIIPLLASMLHKQEMVEDDIKMAIGYADLRRGLNKEEIEKIRRANEIIGALNNLIDILSKGDKSNADT
jgi:hypothetical protein